MLASEEAVAIIANWRTCHAYPLQVIKSGLGRRARDVDPRALIAQRLKRLPSIVYKLKRHPNMKLSQMQDLGGCRAILSSAAQVDRLAQRYQKRVGGHEMVRMTNYIESPKPDGYRSVHLIFKYEHKSQHHADYDGLRVEVQLRSRLQHAWATAVETVSTFTGQALKSNVGDAKWKRFFALMSSAMALRERRPTMPDTPNDPIRLTSELRSLAKDLRVGEMLESWRLAVKYLAPARRGVYAYLLILGVEPGALSVEAYRRNQMQAAFEDYLEIEKSTVDHPGVQAVLVEVDSLAALRWAYPNYYLDSTLFLRAVHRAVDGVLT